MAVLRDYECPACSYLFEEMTTSMIHDLEQKRVFCPKCASIAMMLPVASKSYKIKGANDASITPKKHAAKE